MKSISDERFLAIYEKNKKMVFCVAFSYVKDRACAEDIMQNVFLKLYTQPPHEKEELSGWLATVTRNKCLDLLRHKQFKREVFTEFSMDSFQQSDNFGILSRIDKLPEKYASVLKLFYYGELSIKETATALKISENAVKKRLERARNKLKTLIEEGENDRY